MIFSFVVVCACVHARVCQILFCFVVFCLFLCGVFGVFFLFLCFFGDFYCCFLFCFCFCGGLCVCVCVGGGGGGMLLVSATSKKSGFVLEFHLKKIFY